MMRYISRILFLAALAVYVSSELIKHDNLPGGVGRGCVEEGDCEIICDGKEACVKEIHCHQTYEGKCKIQFKSKSAGSNVVKNSWIEGRSGRFQIKDKFLNSVKAATIYTHMATEIHIETYRESEDKRTEGKYSRSCRGCTVYVQRPGSHLYLEINGFRSFEAANVYAPFGKDSYLSIVCAQKSCRGINIFDDGTTTVFMKPKDGPGSFDAGKVENIFNSVWAQNNLKPRIEYADMIDMDYRGPVHLSNCHGGTGKYQARDITWKQFKWNGYGHGDWFITNGGANAFIDAEINIGDGGRAPNSEDGHVVRLIGVPPENTEHLETEDVKEKTLTEPGTFKRFNLNIASDDYALEAAVSDGYGLHHANIDAKQANSVNINCIQGGGCTGLEVWCPSNECKIYCGWDTDAGDGAGMCNVMNIRFNGDFCTLDGGQALMCDDIKKCRNTILSFSSNSECKLNPRGVCKKGSIPISPNACKTKIGYKPLSLGQYAECSIPEPPPIGGDLLSLVTTLPPNLQCLTNEEYYIQFIIDESGSMKDNFDYVKQFVYNVIIRDINIVSSVSILSFANNIDFIYKFNSIQDPRSDMLSILNNKQLLGGIPDMYTAVLTGIEHFESESPLTENNFMVLLVDDAPGNSFVNYKSPCELIERIQANNIEPIIISIGLEFTETKLDCLSDQYYEIAGCKYEDDEFDMSQFNPISNDLFNVFCEQPTSEPTQQPTPFDIIDAPNDCNKYYAPGMTNLGLNKRVYKGYTPQRMEFEFDIFIETRCKSSECTIFEISSGPTNDQTELAVSLSIKGSDQSFRLLFGCDYNSNPIKEIPTLCNNINDGNRHHIYILFTENELRFDFDWNTLYHETSSESLCANTNFQQNEHTLYLSSYMPLNALVYDFCFKSDDRNMYYTKIPTKTTGIDAKIECEKHGFELASIVNRVEHDRVMKILHDNNNVDGTDGWIGLFDDNNNKIYTWLDGTSCEYAPNDNCNNDIYWEKITNQPDGRDPCVQIEYNDGTYSTEECNDLGYPLCNDPNQIGLTTHEPTKKPSWEPTPEPTTKIPTNTPEPTDYPTPEPTPQPTPEPTNDPTTSQPTIPSQTPTTDPTTLQPTIPSEMPTNYPTTSEPTVPSETPTVKPSAAPTMTCDYQQNNVKQSSTLSSTFKLNLENTFKFKFDYEITENCATTHCNLIQIGYQDQTFLKIDADNQQNWNIQLATTETANSPHVLNSNNPPPIVDNQKHYLEILVNNDNVSGIRIKIDDNIMYKDENYNIPNYTEDQKQRAGEVFMSGFADKPLQTSFENVCVQADGPFTNAPAHSSNLNSIKSWPVNNNNNFGAIKNNYDDKNYYYIGGFISGLIVLFITEILIYLCYYCVKTNNSVAYIEPISQYEDEEKPINIKEEAIIN